MRALFYLPATESSTSRGRINSKRTVILGDPGSGKSTLLSYLILVFAGHVSHGIRKLLRFPFPLVARLRELEKEEAGLTLLDVLSKSMSQVKLPARLLERYLLRGKCIIFLDGLDELLDDRAQRRVVGLVDDFVTQFPENRFVLTCRTAGWRNQLPTFQPYELQSLSNEEIGLFVGNWYREVLRSERLASLASAGDLTHSAHVRNAIEQEALAEANVRSMFLLKAILNSEDILRLSRTPLLLSLITLVHFHKVAELPRGRANLYKLCLNILLDQWEREDKSFQLVSGPSYRDKLLVLKTIAFEYLSRGLLEANLATLG